MSFTNPIARVIKATVCVTVLLHSSLVSAQNDQPERIISAGGSITEIMFELGLGDKLVAVDTSSSHPPPVLSLPKVGYFRSLSAEGILSLDPSLVVAAEGAGPDVVLDQIRSLGVPINSYEQSIYTLDSWKELVLKIGRDFNKTEEANSLAERVEGSIDSLRKNRKYTGQSLNAIALLSIGQRGPIAAGKNTVPDLLFQLAGINNLANELDGYKPFSTELLATQRVDLIFVPSHIVDGLGGKSSICKNKTLVMATAGKCNLSVMDGLLLMGFGARLDEAVSSIQQRASAI